ncbi:LacI family transcriptional regulator [Saccharopolyspora erythraea NRRL 2338]|uniref:Transcriptional regulator, LacI family n=2 Tax=Saccharopolyspora erythraea TaxID=1836 RepID=A4FI33_SACEN|nr:LacI family DNA-binding transcriptional regulator [Saccharopolyspora erythraea]EQD86189.1 LacI family transcription regulator [Saccharopolyspora erythraea D]PFG97391.1 LacI family transcriptional regulator [Saccharopolyspora erythraea NRRL 2338]QRK87572.1 LacI family DNA-binding transcriptional regulator [Saccharopolyspora erythraea]CAM03708.1 transcriptional regulator, LacI family [Saccharopolyspora erythraea NRRL 2338]
MPRSRTGTAARPTLSKVAEAAGVAVSTASLVFSGSGPVSDATRRRVLDAADRLGYAGPDPVARSLRQGRSGIVGVVIGERLLYAFRDPVAVALLDGLTEELAPAGFGLLLLSGSSGRTGPAPEQVERAPLDAVVVESCGGDDAPAVSTLHHRGVPIIGVEGTRLPDVPMVSIDNHGATVELTRHLVELGHRRISVVTLPMRQPGTHRGPLDDSRRATATSTTGIDRLRGVEDALGHAVAAWEASDGLIEEGHRAGLELLAGSPHQRPTAVVAQSDLLAVGVVHAARELGLRIPQDLSVTGFDGIDTPWLGDLRLTTVEQPMTEKGRAAGRMVVDVLAGARPDPVMLPTTLRVRSSTGPAPE